MQTLGVDQLVGRTVGEYQLEQLLGQGQLGTAYLARQRSQGRTVIMTMFNFPEDISARERDQITTLLDQERATLVRLTHPYILPVYDAGEHAGYLYLVTAFAKGASLAQVLKHQGRFTLHQTLGVLKQVAAGLDYAHSQGVVHGILSLSNVLISDELAVQLTGFGLRTLLEVSEKRQNRQPQTYHFGPNGTFLGSPASISPERVLDKLADARSDIYALGVMLFELLSGTPPFRGATPLDMALQRLQQPVPSVHAVCPDVPEALELVLSKLLERDPAKRYQRAGKSAAAFERVLTLLEAAQRATDSKTQQLARTPQISLPPTVNWYEEAGIPSGKWQSLSSMVTLPLPAVTSSPSLQKTACDEAETRQMKLPGAATPSDAPADTLPMKAALPSPVEGNPDSMAGADQFARWSATSVRPGTPPPAPGTFTQRAPVHPARSNPRSCRRPAQQDRRKLVMLIAAGTAAVFVGEISFAHFVQSMQQSPSQIPNVPAAGSTSAATPTGNTLTTGPAKGMQTTSTPSKSPTAKPSPTKVPQPSPTSQPTQQPTPRPTQSPTPTPPPHTGTVIGYTTQPKNSSQNFTNPADGQGSVLLHLSNGNFVACERACTHAGVPVNYDPGSGQLVCPAHGAIFDPLHGFSHVSGPGNGPLATVSIRVNGDGTITTG